MTYEFLGDPVAKPRMTQADKWKQRAPVMKYRGFCDLLRLQMNLQKFPYDKTPGTVNLIFTLPIPASKKKLLDKNPNTAHTETPDIDNLVKGVLDALFKQDKQIHTIFANKHYGLKTGIKIELIYDNHD